MAIPRGFPPTYTCLPIHSEQILSSTPSVTRVGSDENTQQHTSTLPIPREDYSAIDYAVSPPLDENRSMFVRRFERCATLMVDSPRLERSELESIGCGYGWGAPIQGNVVLEGSMATAWGGVVEVEVKVSSVVLFIAQSIRISDAKIDRDSSRVVFAWDLPMARLVHIQYSTTHARCTELRAGTRVVWTLAPHVPAVLQQAASNPLLHVTTSFLRFYHSPSHVHPRTVCRLLT